LKSSQEALHITEDLLNDLDKYAEGLKIKSDEQVIIDVDPVSFY
jgi:hypothetical protein